MDFEAGAPVIEMISARRKDPVRDQVRPSNSASILRIFWRWSRSM